VTDKGNDKNAGLKREKKRSEEKRMIENKRHVE
jgi:hypothetical protein